MKVYYVADDEKPKNADIVKFYTDHASAMSASIELRSSVYSFDVNDKCETNSFGMDTIMLFNKDPETGELKFLASGRWVELHEIMNIPFYYDFEARIKNIVSMSLQYFNSHYKISPIGVKQSIEQVEVKTDINTQVKSETVLNSQIEASEQFNQTIDDDIINELFMGV